MKTATEVSPEKLMGGFYSPPDLVRVCLDRIKEHLGDVPARRILEPSAGDGAFLRGLRDHVLATEVEAITAIEVRPEEAQKAREALRQSGIDGTVIDGSALGWACEAPELFEAAIGNPPFVRFQFVAPTEREHVATIEARLGLSFAGVSNLWIPLLLGALSHVRPGGAYAFIVPAECFTGISAHVARSWLLHNSTAVCVDLFPPDSFPGVLQEVVVLSGRIGSRTEDPSHELRVREHNENGSSVTEWIHQVDDTVRTWTRYLLTPRQVAAVSEAAALTAVDALGEVAKFEVATVTGANDFFCVDDATVEGYGLAPWSVPMLPRVRHAKGLAFTTDDVERLSTSGERTNLLHFAADRPNPNTRPRARTYLQLGEDQALPGRHKCSIREPWFRVPLVAPGKLLMSKRSHHFPRVIVNEANVVTTDTIYRGRLLDAATSPSAFAAAFHNSLTLLTAEIEGRSFGGGVLELVPSEISRLLVVRAEGMADELGRLDEIARSGRTPEVEGLIEETDSLLTKRTAGLTPSLMHELQGARDALLGRRLARTG